MNIIFLAISLFGLAKLLLAIYDLLKKTVLGRPHNLPERYGKNTWAVITGGSEGIGLGIAKRLAKEGFNIVIISRSQTKLDAAKSEIQAENPLIEVKTLSRDFSNAFNAEFFEGIAKELEGLDVSILVNNVGIMPIMENLEYTPQKIKDTIVINCSSQIGMSRILLPKMSKRTLKSAQIDLSSVASLAPVTSGAVYSASKIFNKFISDGLASYVNNVDFLCVKPAAVSTALNNHAKVDNKLSIHKAVTVADCVDGIFKALGHVPETCGADAHNYMFGLNIFKLFPTDIVPSIAGMVSPKSYREAHP